MFNCKPSSVSAASRNNSGYTGTAGQTLVCGKLSTFSSSTL